MSALRRPSRYVQVGALCALINNAIVVGLDRLGYHYAIGVTAGFLVVMAVGYRLHTGYTFQASASLSGWLRFVVANLSGFPLALGAMFLLCDVIGLRASWAMPIATVLLLFWNYSLAWWIIARPLARDRRVRA